MSEFHRMITYLYLYEQGIKNRNIGFAKVEQREQHCLLEIHMKNTGCSLSPVQVYFYVQKGQQLGGILLGKFTLNRGSGEFKTAVDTKNIGESGYPLEHVKGIYIPLTERTMLVSQWDDDEFRRESFVDLADLPVQMKQPVPGSELSGSLEAPVSLENQKSDDTSEPPVPLANQESSSFGGMAALPEQEPPQSQENAITEKVQEPSQLLENPSAPPVQDPPSPPDTPALSTPESSFEEKAAEFLHAAQTSVSETPAGTKDALKAVEALPITERKPAAFHTVSRTPRNAKTSPTSEPDKDNSQQKSESSEDWRLRWRFILENYPVMTPFSGDENTLCVRLELKDIRQLPKQFWYFGNNSFLLHGFFNYRYIILGMTEEFGVKKWFIGIPGVFQNPERVMAALFGFPEFRSEKPSSINTGQFGYWYRYLNELSQPAKTTPS